MPITTINTPVVIAAAQAHAIASWPNEAVGFVIGGAYEPQVNVAIYGSETFAVADEAYLR